MAGGVLGASAALVDLHAWWAWVVVVANGIVGCWALGAHRWPALRVPPLWWCTIAAEVAVFVQVVLGVVVIQGRTDEDFGFHLLYGFSAAFAVGILYSYRAQLADKIYLLYGCGGLFITGVALRAMTNIGG